MAAELHSRPNGGTFTIITPGSVSWNVRIDDRGRATPNGQDRAQRQAHASENNCADKTIEAPGGERNYSGWKTPAR